MAPQDRPRADLLLGASGCGDRVGAALLDAIVRSVATGAFLWNVLNDPPAPVLGHPGADVFRHGRHCLPVSSLPYTKRHLRIHFGPRHLAWTTTKVVDFPNEGTVGAANRDSAAGFSTWIAHEARKGKRRSHQRQSRQHGTSRYGMARLHAVGAIDPFTKCHFRESR